MSTETPSKHRSRSKSVSRAGRTPVKRISAKNSNPITGSPKISIIKSSPKDKVNKNDKLTAKPKYTETSQQHFSMIKEIALADLITLLNSTFGTLSLFASLTYVATKDIHYLYAAILSLPLALFFDFLDGRIARWKGTSSPMGKELDSLADIISFGVAPAVLGFASGLQGMFDIIGLIFFVNCGVARLARYNVTSSYYADINGKVPYFEGTPIPTTVLITLLIGYLIKIGQYGDFDLPFGKQIVYGWTFHPFSLIYVLSGILQVSKTIRIPKL